MQEAVLGGAGRGGAGRGGAGQDRVERDVYVMGVSTTILGIVSLPRQDPHDCACLCLRLPCGHNTPGAAERVG
ncbi:hypothetical protein E2C01_044196 [Portunus trituberculatus]|uniref:Uncharacterized protein n=1 Tax=Portunus trituberculatus TaxID=210409 RepID=A0A5B7FYP4_PORTR|nr:hypothetical protein [Portunus trituberculatus]